MLRKLKLPNSFPSLLFLSICLMFYFSVYEAMAEVSVPKVLLSNDFSEEGYLKIDWEWEDQPAEFEVWVNDVRVYKGAERGTFVSGLADGRYLIKVGVVAASNPDTIFWSESSELRVRHKSENIVYLFVSLGGLVFLLTVFVIFVGSKRAIL